MATRVLTKLLYLNNQDFQNIGGDLQVRSKSTNGAGVAIASIVDQTGNSYLVTTSAAHGLSDGALVSIISSGNTFDNRYIVTVTGANTFLISFTSGSGTETGTMWELGGITWEKMNLDPAVFENANDGQATISDGAIADGKLAENYLKQTADTALDMDGNAIAMGDAAITELADPTNAQDAATKHFVEQFLTGIQWQHPVLASDLLVNNSTGINAGVRAQAALIIYNNTAIAGSTITFKDGSSNTDTLVEGSGGDWQVGVDVEATAIALVQAIEGLTGTLDLDIDAGYYLFDGGNSATIWMAPATTNQDENTLHSLGNDWQLKVDDVTGSEFEVYIFNTDPLNLGWTHVTEDDTYFNFALGDDSPSVNETHIEQEDDISYTWNTENGQWTAITSAGGALTEGNGITIDQNVISVNQDEILYPQTDPLTAGSDGDDSYTLTKTPRSNDDVKLFYGGTKQEKSLYSVNGTAVTITDAELISLISSGETLEFTYFSKTA